MLKIWTTNKKSLCTLKCGNVAIYSVCSIIVYWLLADEIMSKRGVEKSQRVYLNLLRSKLGKCKMGGWGIMWVLWQPAHSLRFSLQIILFFVGNKCPNTKLFHLTCRVCTCMLFKIRQRIHDKVNLLEIICTISAC